MTLSNYSDKQGQGILPHEATFISKTFKKTTKWDFSGIIAYRYGHLIFKGEIVEKQIKIALTSDDDILVTHSIEQSIKYVF